MAYDLHAYLLPHEMFRVIDGARIMAPVTTQPKHRHGRYDTKDLARWWAINANGVWHGGDTGPRDTFYPKHMICHFKIEEV